MAMSMFKIFGRESAPEPEKRKVSPEEELGFARKKLALLNKLEAAALDFQKWKNGQLPEVAQTDVLSIRGAILEEMAALKKTAEGTNLDGPEYDDKKFLEEALKGHEVPAEAAPIVEKEKPFEIGDLVVLSYDKDPENKNKDMDHWKVLTPPNGKQNVMEIEKWVRDPRTQQEKYMTKLVRVEEVKRTEPY